MKTKDQLLAEVNGFKFISEETESMFRKVINTVEADLTPDQWWDYELALEQYQQTVVEYRTAREEGESEGLAKGRKEGREEMRIKNARALKVKGISFDIISECLGLSVEEIQRL